MTVSRHVHLFEGEKLTYSTLLNGKKTNIFLFVRMKRDGMEGGHFYQLGSEVVLVFNNGHVYRCNRRATTNMILLIYFRPCLAIKQQGRTMAHEIEHFPGNHFSNRAQCQEHSELEFIA